jgi:hypothetical protein
MGELDRRAPAVADAVIVWTTSVALIAFGVIFLDDSAIMGPTILALGILMSANAALKLLARRAGAAGGFGRLRLLLSVLYAALVLSGFLGPSLSH